MKTHTETEENYLKCIWRNSNGEDLVSTNTIAYDLGTSAASVSDMIKKLHDKELIHYKKRKGVRLTESGTKVALKILRKHRLWEVFLVEKLQFSWDNVHDIAEQLEHINSPELIRQLDVFLGFPKFDPHGDPIPNEEGEMAELNTEPLASIPEGETATIVSVKRSDQEFLQYLDRVGLTIGTEVQLVEKLSFDDSLQLSLQQQKMVVSGTVGDNLLVVRN
ncbi:MAG: metal-dependent transcriptional regulator [Bacteroidota bacterium]